MSHSDPNAIPAMRRELEEMFASVSEIKAALMADLPKSSAIKDAPAPPLVELEILQMRLGQEKQWVERERDGLKKALLQEQQHSGKLVEEIRRLQSSRDEAHTQAIHELVEAKNRVAALELQVEKDQQRIASLEPFCVIKDLLLDKERRIKRVAGDLQKTPARHSRRKALEDQLTELSVQRDELYRSLVGEIADSTPQTLARAKGQSSR